MPAAAAIPVPDGTPPEVAALIGCCVTTGVGAATKTAEVQPGSSVVVIGLGGVGLSCVMGAALAGASTIVAVDRVAGQARPGARARRDGRPPRRPGRRRDAGGDPRPDRRRPRHVLRGDRPAGDDRDRDRLPADRRHGGPRRDDAVRGPGVVRAVPVRRRRPADPRLELRLGGSGGRLPALRGAPPRRPAAGRSAGDRPDRARRARGRVRGDAPRRGRPLDHRVLTPVSRSARPVGGARRRAGGGAADGRLRIRDRRQERLARDQARAAAVGQEAPRPADGHDDPVREPDQVDDVDRRATGTRRRTRSAGRTARATGCRSRRRAGRSPRRRPCSQ